MDHKTVFDFLDSLTNNKIYSFFYIVGLKKSIVSKIDSL